MATMKEIARQTGVSVSTVSLVLNNRDEGRVKPHIAQQVRQTAERLGYAPNPLARSLRTSRTKILGFISEEIATTPFAGGIILGSQDAASTLGYMMITVNTDGVSNEDDEIAALQRYGVDGFLYAKMSNRLAQIPQSITDYPVVLVDATSEGHRFPSIQPDEFRIGYDATKCLIEAGCKKIAYIGCDDDMPAQIGRLQGYRQALEDAGLHFDECRTIAIGGHGPALSAVSKLFDNERPDGFFCFNDARAWYVYECAARRGLEIGRDISVVGVDNHRVFAETLHPRLTTVELPHYEMGYWAVCRLVSEIEHRPPSSFIMPATTAQMPALDAPAPASIHCTLINKESVARQA